LFLIDLIPSSSNPSTAGTTRYLFSNFDFEEFYYKVIEERVPIDENFDDL